MEGFDLPPQRDEAVDDLRDEELVGFGGREHDLRMLVLNARTVKTNESIRIYIYARNMCI